MSPIEQYNSIIYFRQQYPLVKGERHHIIPKSCGGCNRKWNLVKLTPEEHIECHRLLTLIYPTGDEHFRMCAAYALMCTSRSKVKVSDEQAAEARRLSSESRKGRPSPKKGKPGKSRKRTEEEKRAISEGLKGKPHPWQVGKPSGMKGKTAWNKGMHYHTGQVPWNKDKKLPPSWNAGKKMPPRSEEWCQRIREAALRRWARKRAEANN